MTAISSSARDIFFNNMVYTKQDGTSQLQGEAFTLLEFLSYPNDLANCAVLSKEFAKAAALRYKMLLKPSPALLELVEKRILNPEDLTKKPSQLFKDHPASREQFVAFDSLGLKYIEGLVQSNIPHYPYHDYTKNLAYTTPNINNKLPSNPHNFYETATKIDILIQHLKNQIAQHPEFIPNKNRYFFPILCFLARGIESGLTYEQVTDDIFDDSFSFHHAKAARLGIPFKIIRESNEDEVKILVHRRDLSLERIRILRNFPINIFAVSSILIDYPHITPEILRQLADEEYFFTPYEFEAFALGVSIEIIKNSSGIYSLVKKLKARKKF